VRQNIQNGAKSHFQLQKGLLWYKQNRFYVPEGKSRDIILKECPDGSLAVSQPHFGAKCEDTTHTPKSGKMESSGTPENSKDNLKGQISLPCYVFYMNGKFLKRRCPKWPRMGHLDICSPSYGQKKGRKSNYQFDSRPLKVRNRPLPDIS
jgi:hypothetical protein